MQNLSVRKPAILVVSLTLLGAPSSFAQVVPDGTVNTRVTPEGNTFVIEEGTTRGRNLFHSFQSFSVPTGNTAYFNNDSGIQNIISRVTGTSISNIDGILKANGTANLFLLNPNGIIFGKNAQLNIGGSFLGTTADSIKFADGTQFSATNPQSSNLLTIAVPVGLNFINSSGEIHISGSGHQLPAGVSVRYKPTSRENNPQGLQVLPGKTLALVGGDVFLNDGVVYAPGGQIEIGSVKQGQITVDTTNDQWSFNYDTQSTFGKILLSNSSLLDTSGPGGASLEIYGRQILFEDNSVVLMLNEGIIPDKELKLQATDLIYINNDAPLNSLPAGLHSGATNLGSSAHVTLISPAIILRDGSIIDSKTFTSAKGGNISIKARDYLKIEGTSDSRPQVVSEINAITFASGNAGDIYITTSNLLLNEGGRLSSVTFGQGTGGKVFVKADLVEILGIEPKTQQASMIQAGTLGTGNAGSLNIDTSKLILAKGGSVSTTTLNSGDGGSLTINASEFVEVNGMDSQTMLKSEITAEAIQVSPILRRFFPLPPVPTGNSGNITINTPRLSLTDGGQVSVFNEGTGDAGELKIFASNIILKNGSAITASTEGGDGGNLYLFAKNFLLLDNGTISASSKKQGTGGNIAVKADLVVALGKSSITANAEDAQGGNIYITAKGVLFSPDFVISTSSKRGLQSSGTVKINTEQTKAEETALPIPDVVPVPKVISACNPSSEPSRFVVMGPGALKAEPHNFVSTESLVGTPVYPTASRSQTTQTTNESAIVEATGLKIDKGKIILFAENQTNSNNLLSGSSICNRT